MGHLDSGVRAHAHIILTHILIDKDVYSAGLHLNFGLKVYLAVHWSTHNHIIVTDGVREGGREGEGREGGRREGGRREGGSRE